MDQLQLRGRYPWPVALPAVGGAAGCGVIEGGDHAGQQVLLPIRAGTWRDGGHWPWHDLVPIPAIDPVQASMLVVNGLTADDLLQGLSAGDVVVQSPGAGGVGQLVDQLCARRGIRCVNVVRRPPLRPLVGEVVDRPPLGLKAARALDGVGGDMTRWLGAATDDGGTVWHYGAMSRQPPCLNVADAIFRGVKLEDYWLRRASAARAPGLLAERLQALARMELQVAVAGTWRLSEWREAMAFEGQGVVVFTP
jgi:NADPH:quinone reductase-like Zn-dependent oxidoreductase